MAICFCFLTLSINLLITSKFLVFTCIFGNFHIKIDVIKGIIAHKRNTLIPPKDEYVTPPDIAPASAPSARALQQIDWILPVTDSFFVSLTMILSAHTSA
jgi:hypothetical protein